MANALIRLTPDTLEPELILIGELPLYNEDLEAAPPAEWVSFRKHLASFDGVLFVTPEYNRSVPAVLKNTIDVASTKSFLKKFMEDFPKCKDVNAGILKY